MDNPAHDFVASSIRTLLLNGAPAAAFLALFITLALELFTPRRQKSAFTIDANRKINDIWICLIFLLVVVGTMTLRNQLHF